MGPIPAVHQVVLTGYHKADPMPAPSGRSLSGERQSRTRCGPNYYPACLSPTTPAGVILFATRTVDPICSGG